MAIEGPDPLTLALAPPPNETPAERWQREQKESDARRISDQIDEEIKAEKKLAEKKRKKVIRVLLLGQSESGKSTTVKNFQMAYAHNQFLEERESWKTVIHLNLVRSVNTILDVLSKEISQLSTLPSLPVQSTASPLNSPSSPSSPTSRSRSRSHSPFRFSPDISSSNPQSDTDELEEDSSDSNDPKLSPYHHHLMTQGPASLAPLRPRKSTSKQSLLASSNGPMVAGTNPNAVTIDHLTNLLLHLSPIARRIQSSLEQHLGAASSDDLSSPSNPHAVAPWQKLDSSASTGTVGENDTSIDGSGTRGRGRRPKEFFVTSRVGWRAALERVRPSLKLRISSSSRFDEDSDESGDDEGRGRVFGEKGKGKQSAMNVDAETYEDAVAPKLKPRKHTRHIHSHHHATASEPETEIDQTTSLLLQHAQDIHALWTDPVVQGILSRRKIKVRLEDGPGFFLNDALRILSLTYTPTSDDVVRARLRTMGVQEYKFTFEKGSTSTGGGSSSGSNSSHRDAITGSGAEGLKKDVQNEAGREWILYDVGGARSSRNAWYPYFDTMNAIIFLAPINCFDERLAEDKRVNRLEDSLLLWKAVVGCKILRKVQFILFLNKCDLLQKKIMRGVKVSDYVASYGDKPNDAKTVAKYFRQQFKDILMRHSPDQRGFYSYLTSVVDTKATAITVSAVREGIQRNQLKEAEII